jgi:flavin reductase (DIM6/NTAB) family NADH-FMN oxidoreductase RutF
MSSKAEPAARVHVDLAPVDAGLYRRACAQFTTGITVVTVVDQQGHPHGVTMNSFSSVSLDPPLVLVSIDLRSAILGHFLSSPVFAINILAEHQERLSRTFSSPAENRFHGVDWHPASSGTPLLDGALAHLECSTMRTFETGDHVVLIGQVQRAAFSEGEKPLVYFNSAYRNLDSGKSGS